MQTVFVVQGQGFGDSEDEFYNIQAFTSLTLAEQYVADLQEQDLQDDNNFVYSIDEVTLAA